METARKEVQDLRRSVDLQEVVKRVVKYLIEGAAVAVAAYYIPQRKMELEEVLMIAITAAATFALLDLFAPSISGAARSGAGLGIGANLVGFPM
jgi:ABC-type Co2+ transport system permease subunit